MDAMVVKDEMDLQQMCDENVPRDDDGKMGAENSTILNLSDESKIDEEITDVDTENVLICENKGVCQHNPTEHIILHILRNLISSLNHFFLFVS
jgi:hypothetical protein